MSMKKEIKVALIGGMTLIIVAFIHEIFNHKKHNGY